MTLRGEGRGIRHISTRQSQNIGDPYRIIYVQTPKHEETVLVDLQSRVCRAGYSHRVPEARPEGHPPRPMLQERLDSGQVSPKTRCSPPLQQGRNPQAPVGRSPVARREVHVDRGHGEKARFPLPLV